MPSSSLFKRSWVALPLVAVIGLLPLISNPGYFNFDELQKADDIDRFGIWSYLLRYIDLTPGSTFGKPVRPVSFAIEGLQATLMDRFPFLVHATDVLMHLVVAALLVRVIFDFLKDARLALIAAVLFLCSPLSIVAVGWNAALMDRLFVLFTLSAMLAARRLLDGAGLLGWIVLLTSAILAILCKETAAVAPGLLVIFALLEPAWTKQRRFWGIFVVWALPSVALVAWRAGSVLNSFSTETVAFYQPSIRNVPVNLLVYAAYPFLPWLTEALNWVFLPAVDLTVAAGAHLVLVACLWRLASWRAAAAYVAAYFLFLMPVILLPAPGAHWMYASGAAFSAVLAVVVRRSLTSRRWAVLIPACLMVAVSGFHSLNSEFEVYRIGACMNREAISLESAFVSLGSPRDLTIVGEDGAPSYMIHRLLDGRDRIGSSYGISFSIVDDGTPGAGELLFRKDCLISRV